MLFDKKVNSNTLVVEIQQFISKATPSELVELQRKLMPVVRSLDSKVKLNQSKKSKPTQGDSWSDCDPHSI